MPRYRKPILIWLVVLAITFVSGKLIDRWIDSETSWHRAEKTVYVRATPGKPSVSSEKPGLRVTAQITLERRRGSPWWSGWNEWVTLGHRAISELLSSPAMYPADVYRISGWGEVLTDWPGVPFSADERVQITRAFVPGAAPGNTFTFMRSRMDILGAEVFSGAFKLVSALSLAALIWLIISRHRSRSRIDRGQCPKCAYPLMLGVCNECGWDTGTSSQRTTAT